MEIIHHSSFLIPNSFLSLHNDKLIIYPSVEIYQYVNLDYIETSGFSCTPHVRYESHERSSPEDGRPTVTSCFRCDDHQPLYWNADRYFGHSIRSVINRNNGDDRLLRQRRSAHFGTSHFCHHGCQYRYNAYRMDYGSGYIGKRNLSI